MSVYEKRGGNGGRRSGAGRPRGSMNARSFLHTKSLKEKFPITPLEYLLSIVNDRKASSARRDAAARAAAPYVHPRLSAIEVRPEEPPARPQRYIDDSALTDEERRQFNMLFCKMRITDTPPSPAQQIPTRPPSAEPRQRTAL